MRRSIPEIAAELRRLVATAPSDATLVEDVERDLGADLCEQDRRMARERAAETRRGRKALREQLQAAQAEAVSTSAARSIAMTTGECAFGAGLVLLRKVDLAQLRGEHAGLTAALAALGASVAGVEREREEAVAKAAARTREIAVALRDLSPGPHPCPMDAEDYIPLVKSRIEDLERKRVALRAALSVLAHSYDHDSRPPKWVLDVARKAALEERAALASTLEEGSDD